MEYIKHKNGILLRLDPGEEIIESVLKVVEKEDIKTASISGIGATDKLKIGVFNLDTKTYDNHVFSGNHEIVNLCGSISQMDNKPYQHMHITCANKEGKCVGGHLIEANISLTCEIFIQEVDFTINRKFNPEIGLNQWKFE